MCSDGAVCAEPEPCSKHPICMLENKGVEQVPSGEDGALMELNCKGHGVRLGK